MLDDYIELVNKEPDIELFGKKLIIVDPEWHGHNWCSMCGLNDICEQGTKFEKLPCEKADGTSNRHFIEVK